jgi:3-phosphoshikimate 1-carboxyvinyltransferase
MTKNNKKMSKNVLVSFNGNKQINTEIRLTGSKSECNRALVISALSKGSVKAENLGIAADTVTLNKVLSQLTVGHSQLATGNQQLETANRELVNIGPAGTAMRFLTAYLPTQSGSFELTGTERMKQRPIGILAEALKSIGADISYLEQEGFPPLQINGPLQQTSATVKIKGDISSQYISALLMIAPTLPLGLTLQIEGELTSKPYVEMTLAMLDKAGIKHNWSNNEISIAKQDFNAQTLYVEPDWSAASYWYAVAALADEASIFLPGLQPYSLQGDSVITEIMASFGITSQFVNGGVQLIKEQAKFTDKVYDLKECPDLAQTIVVVCAALGYNATFTGLETLKIKETDRVLALQTELAKIGVKFIEKDLFYTLDCSGLHFPEKITVATYEDHRMAMAFAPLALKINTVEIEEEKVVEKSYPDYWIDLQKAGFGVV